MKELQLLKQDARKITADRLLALLGILCTLACLTTLSALVFDLVADGADRISYGFLTSFPSRFAGKAGILSAWVGTLLVMLVTVFCAVPLGVAAAVYLEEYGRKGWITELIEISVTNLAGVPSVVYGLMALGVFVYGFGLGHSIITAGLTLGFLVLPIVIVASREALRSIPQGVREASLALGATKWETIRYHLLPYSVGGILTGVIIAMSRAIGETAPLVTIGALTFIAFLPPPPLQAELPFLNLDWLSSPFTVLPIQMFNWISRPQHEFHLNAAATGLVLIVLTLSLNLIAIVIRHRSRRRVKW